MKKTITLAIMVLATSSHAQTENGQFLANYYAEFFIEGVEQMMLLSGKHSEVDLACVGQIPKQMYADTYFTALQKGLSPSELADADDLYAGELGSEFVEARRRYVVHEKNRLTTGKSENYEVDKKQKALLMSHAKSPLGKKIALATTNPEFKLRLMADFSKAAKKSCGVVL